MRLGESEARWGATLEKEHFNDEFMNSSFSIKVLFLHCIISTLPMEYEICSCGTSDDEGGVYICGWHMNVIIQKFVHSWKCADLPEPQEHGHGYRSCKAESMRTVLDRAQMTHMLPRDSWFLEGLYDQIIQNGDDLWCVPWQRNIKREKHAARKERAAQREARIEFFRQVEESRKKEQANPTAFQTPVVCAF